MKKAASRICARCHLKKTAPGRSRCAACAKLTRLEDAARRRRRRRARLCAECGRKPAPGRKLCRYHLDYHAEWNRRRRQENA